jgi:hypothetical protein
MDHGSRLEWRTIGAWRYALGNFGTIQGFDTWTVRVGERFAGFFRNLEAARRMLEDAALAARYDVAP